MPLLLAHLAMPNRTFPPVGLRVPSLDTRLAVCANLIAIADLFERQGLVYGDWGYKNIFWSQKDSSVYFIDIDACSYGAQPWVESFGFADPFTPANQRVDTYTDRFRCAIAIAACLVGDKDPQSAVSGLATLRSKDGRVERLATVVRQMATAPDRTQRLPIGVLQSALSGESQATAGVGATTTSTTRTEATPDGMNIVGWDDVEPLPTRVVRPASPSTAHAARQPAATSGSTAGGVTTSTGAPPPATQARPTIQLTAEQRRARRNAIAAVTVAVLILLILIAL